MSEEILIGRNDWIEEREISRNAESLVTMTVDGFISEQTQLFQVEKVKGAGLLMQ